MKDHTSLDRMHDIVIPEPIPWWPPAPGWYVVFAVVLCVILVLVIQAWKRWWANAYRRTAQRELKTASSVADISEVLRRTALVVMPRSIVAAQVGSSWPKWLEATSPAVMSERVRQQLTIGPYDPGDSTADVSELRAYAISWIRRH